MKKKTKQKINVAISIVFNVLALIAMKISFPLELVFCYCGLISTEILIITDDGELYEPYEDTYGNRKEESVDISTADYSPRQAEEVLTDNILQ